MKRLKKTPFAQLMSWIFKIFMRVVQKKYENHKWLTEETLKIGFHTAKILLCNVDGFSSFHCLNSKTDKT